MACPMQRCAILIRWLGDQFARRIESERETREVLRSGSDVTKFAEVSSSLPNFNPNPGEDPPEHNSVTTGLHCYRVSLWVYVIYLEETHDFRQKEENYLYSHEAHLLSFEPPPSRDVHYLKQPLNAQP